MKATPDYTHLSTEEACLEKWKVGREAYGPEFVGDPLLELDGELLDAINYVDEAERQGIDVGMMRAEVAWLRDRVVGLVRKREK